ncbi:type II secretion system F family protein [Sphingomonas rubra]|uniref:Tight adherence protein B n=1 Tax=Sphingomonas rubra TaxID=634430 RepID=A0A1I5UEL8_9SPHN|nr:type II secretion system F family protein [Sphingomonas rubra]SFP93658.1 tight adherence protein B [Sphingomonas rubra]
MLSMLVLMLGAATVLAMVVLALMGPSAERAGARRVAALRDRHGPADVIADAQARRIAAVQATRMDLAFGKVLPNRAQLAKRLAMTGKSWTVGNYGLASAGLAVGVALLLMLRGAPLLLTLFLALIAGLGLPHLYVGRLIGKRINAFTVRFPEAIELLVRGLRSGLPISETMGVVGAEMNGPVGEEFRGVADKMKIGRTMDAALQETADRLGTPEFQFFVITIAIQRETGGNLAETLSNLADVLRKRAQMKLKIKAMSSEAKASAYILGALPFAVTMLIYLTAPDYVGNFLTDQRLMIAGGGGLIWMSIGGFVMAKMVSFEI